jgi:excisionase family DNA binding protein
VQELLVSPARAAQILSLSRSSLYQLLARHEIRAIHIGRATRIPTMELNAWLARQEAEQWAG